MQVQFVNAMEVLKVSGIIFGTATIAWQVFSGVKAFVDTLTHSKTFMEQAAQDLKAIKESATTVVDNHLTHIQGDVEKFSSDHSQVKEHLCTMVGEMKSMRQDFYAHQIDEVRVQEGLANAVANLSSDIKAGKRSRSIRKSDIK